MSIRNVLLKGILRATRKPIYASERSLRSHVFRVRSRENEDQPRASAERISRFEKDSWRGVPTYTVRPRHGEDPKGHVLYLHGGGYFEGMGATRWRVIAELVDRGGVTATVPLYPLAPEYSHHDTYPWLIDLYRHLCDTVGPNDLTVFGDSAGGGMALSLVQQAVGRGLPHPKQTLLLSPWLDLTLDNPAIHERERLDPVLASAGLAVAARWWAGGEDLASPIISPIYGSMAGIGPVFVAIGTHDSLHPDAVAFRERARAAGVDVEFIEGEGLAHLFMFMPIPEAGPVMDRIVERLAG